MDTSFQQYFSNACDNSKYDFLMQERKSCPAYVEASQKCKEILENIKEKLGENYRLLYQLEKVEGERKALEDDFIYQKGFRDCFFVLY